MCYTKYVVKNKPQNKGHVIRPKNGKELKGMKQKENKKTALHKAMSELGLTVEQSTKLFGLINKNYQVKKATVKRKAVEVEVIFKTSKKYGVIEVINEKSLIKQLSNFYKSEAKANQMAKKLINKDIDIIDINYKEYRIKGGK